MKPFPKILGAELYLCGGNVRDTLLGKEPKDRDFVIITSMTFDETIKAIETIPNAKIFLAKPEFLTIRCLIEGEPIDIAFPRSDGTYSDNRRPDSVSLVGSLKEDASRRDFTINSMYMREDGTIIDYFDGRTDLELGSIRCVNNADERFKEDALRMLRALRFSLKLDFVIDYDTAKAIRANTKLLYNISGERIKDELNKCLLIDAQSTVLYMTQYGLYDIVKHKGLTFELTNRER